MFYRNTYLVKSRHTHMLSICTCTIPDYTCVQYFLYMQDCNLIILYVIYCTAYWVMVVKNARWVSCVLGKGRHGEMLTMAAAPPGVMDLM